ncbi:hypothetical protein [Desulfofalx alkaliphila]|uniref:hypothetical protein n=1 Tax=Desulfofalx alkaliphila TaxID=105483 RepID=UPI0004E1CB14|nr:hypothetical protein [Desulfofalx alkaliphila]
MFSIYGLFAPSLSLELGINKLKEQGFMDEKLTVVVLDANYHGRQKLFDSINFTDGKSLMDGVAMGAAIGMLFGVIYGSVVFIGPIALGLIGFAIGGTVGYLLDRSINKKPKEGKAPSGEVIVIVRCINEEEAYKAEKIMRAHQVAALGRRIG